MSIKNFGGGGLPPAGSQQIYVDGAYISPQYIACASLAKYLGENIELGLIRDCFERAVFKRCSTKIIPDNITKRTLLQVSENTIDKDLYFLLKDFRLPVVGQGMYKTDIWKWYKEQNYLEVRSKINFCQSPLIHEDGTYEPCGTCAACIAVIQEKVLEPFTKEGLRRYNDYEKNHEKEPERFRLKIMD